MELDKKILVLMPKTIDEGQPSYQRIRSFAEFFRGTGVEVSVYDAPRSLREKISFVLFLYKNRIKNVFVSMPPFRNWYLFLMPGISVIWDIRDGWSIAMRSGYGGTAKPNRLKASVCGIIERIALWKSTLTITVSAGLQRHLQKMTKKRIALITNGISQANYDVIREIKRENKRHEGAGETAVCAGQFSEYGMEKVKMVLTKINARGVVTHINLIGCDSEKNKWIGMWLKENNLRNITVHLLPRMGRREMYREIINADYGIVIIRDPDYDYGTKIYDYIACGIPVFNYFDAENEFTRFFHEFLTDSRNYQRGMEERFIRERIINENAALLMGRVK